MIVLNMWFYMVMLMFMLVMVVVVGVRWLMVFFIYSVGFMYWIGCVLGKVFLVDLMCIMYVKMMFKVVLWVLICWGVDESKVGKWESRIEFAVFVL